MTDDTTDGDDVRSIVDAYDRLEWDSEVYRDFNGDTDEAPEL